LATDGEYTQADTFLGAASTSKVFVVLVDDQGRARIRFGNGISGAIPQGNITAEYKVGGGVVGEVEANAVWTIDTAINDEFGVPVSLEFTNPTSSQPAADPISVAEARVRGPLSVRTIKRAVIEEDFEFVATQTPSIARAFMATSDNSEDITEDAGRLELVAFGTKLLSGRFEPATPNQTTLDEIASKFTQDGEFPAVMGFNIEVTAAPLKTVNVSVRLYKESNFTADAVADNVENALKDFFAVSLDDRTPNLSVDFGAKLLGSDGFPDFEIAWSNVFNAINDTAGVRKISSSTNNLLLNNIHGSVILQPREFPKLGVVTIFDEDQAGLQI